MVHRLRGGKRRVARARIRPTLRERSPTPSHPVLELTARRSSKRKINCSRSLQSLRMLTRLVGERGAAAGDTRLPQDAPSPRGTGLAIAGGDGAFPHQPSSTYRGKSHPGLFPLESIAGNAEGFPDRRRRIRRRLVGLSRFSGASAEKAILAFFRSSRSLETPRVSRIDAAASGATATPSSRGTGRRDRPSRAARPQPRDGTARSPPGPSDA
jgi:hypothetical protein